MRGRETRAIDPVAVMVGANLRRWRQRRGWTQVALAAAIGRDRATVSRWERGERLPSLPTLGLVARTLQCEPGALLAATVTPNHRPMNKERVTHAPTD